MGDENSGEGDDGEAGARRFMVVPPHGGKGLGALRGAMGKSKAAVSTCRKTKNTAIPARYRRVAPCILRVSFPLIQKQMNCL